MHMTFRWFGRDDPIPLAHIRHIPGVSGVVSALYDVPVGAAWTREGLERLKGEIEGAGLTFAVVESIPVHEDIKLGRPGRERLIANYCESVRAMGTVRIPVLCYNFMPVFDWLRTDLAQPLADGSTALAYDDRALAAVDLSRGMADLRPAADHLPGARSRAPGGPGGHTGERRDVLHGIARRRSGKRSARDGAAHRRSHSLRPLSQCARHRRAALSRDGPPVGVRWRGPVRRAAGALRRRLCGADAPRSRAHDLGRARTPRVRPVRPGAGRHVPPGTVGGTDARERVRRMTVRIGLVGCGNISDTHARAAALVPDVEVVAYWGRDPAKVSALAQRYGGKGYRTLDEFLEHRPMELVVVGTPSGVHAEHAQAAAQQGLHVLVEKPLDVTTARIDGLTAECDRAGVKLGVIYQDRAAPDLNWLKRLIV